MIDSLYRDDINDVLNNKALFIFVIDDEVIFNIICKNWDELIDYIISNKNPIISECWNNMDHKKYRYLLQLMKQYDSDNQHIGYTVVKLMSCSSTPEIQESVSKISNFYVTFLQLKNNINKN